jgi:hypothetical protein
MGGKENVGGFYGVNQEPSMSGRAGKKLWTRKISKGAVDTRYTLEAGPYLITARRSRPRCKSISAQTWVTNPLKRRHRWPGEALGAMMELVSADSDRASSIELPTAGE